MIVTTLNGKMASLMAWLSGAWTDEETAVMLMFIAEWESAEIQIRKMKPTKPLVGYLHDDAQQWFPIPTLEIPKRKS